MKKRVIGQNPKLVAGETEINRYSCMKNLRPDPKHFLNRFHGFNVFLELPCKGVVNLGGDFQKGVPGIFSAL